MRGASPRTMRSSCSTAPWLNMSQVTEIKLNPVAAAGTEGFSQFPDVCVGGQTTDARDATNELSYLILESMRALQITAPDPCVRIHAGTPDAFLRHVVECIKDGKGYPELLNDEMVIPFYLANGATMKEALDWCISGCCENRLPNWETNVTAGGGINYGSVVEMTLRRGKLKALRDIQFGLDTGDPRSWISFDEVWAGVPSPNAAPCRACFDPAASRDEAEAGLFRGASDVDAARPRDERGSRSPQPRRMVRGRHRPQHVRGDRQGNSHDSLAAVKHLIFDTKKLTWDELLAAIEANWLEQEATRQMCLSAPKYGNGIAWVDAIGFEIERTLLEFLHSHPKPHGQAFLLRQIPITFHIPLGKVTWATPNGRPAGEYLSEGISASHGMDVKGPTVSLVSIANARDRSFREKAGDLINLKFSPANLAGEEGTHRLMQVIRTWSELKHWHVQFNIINRATLLAAQKEPQKYRDLVVRIAGYSAYFVDLSPMQQAEIIARTEEAA